MADFDIERWDMANFDTDDELDMGGGHIESDDECPGAAGIMERDFDYII